MKFCISGVRFELSFVAVAAMSLVIILDTTGKVVACFLAAVIHECGHILAMCCCHIKPQCIRLRVFDVAIVASDNRPFVPDLFITLSGPVLNLVSAFFFYFFNDMLFVSSVVIGLFNLLPIETFDGGHALLLLLYRRFSEKACMCILKILTLMLLIPCLTLGILMLFYSKYNYSLLLISLYLLAVLFLK